MLYILLWISMTLSVIFLFLNHPLSMGMILLLQTTTLSLISGFMSMTFWFSYVLLLIYLGGMLILFMYVTSLASNEMFLYSNWIILTTLFMLSMMVINFLIFLPEYNLYSLENTENYFNLKFTSYHFLLNMYNHPTNNLTVMIVSYLFLTLIAVAKIIKIYSGPLRQSY